MKDDGHSQQIVTSPNDGTVVGTWDPIGPDLAIRALESIGKAGGRLSGEVAFRRALLEGWRHKIDEQRKLLVDLVIDEVGKTPSEASGEIDYALTFIDTYIDALDWYEFDVWVEDSRRVEELPIGTALVITPFNDPVAGITRKVAPALAAGCPVLIKPSPLGMLTGKFLSGLIPRVEGHEVAGVLATDDGTLISDIIKHPALGIVTFTGGTNTGAIIGKLAGEAVRPAVLELGGNCPLVALEDADPQKVAADIVDRKRKCAGQACSAINRAFIHESIFDDVFDEIVHRVSKLRAGPARGDGIDMGPVRTGAARHYISSLVETAVNNGEEAVCGLVDGGSYGYPPYAVPMTVLKGSKDSRSVLDKDEAFGPVFSIRPFSNEKEVQEVVSRELHALAAYVYCGDVKHAERFCAPLRFGSVGINSVGIQGAHVPTGGFGNAGYGREGGIYGLREFLTTRNIRIGNLV